ncbi:hypothetical protein FA13DRAFT_1718584 [Coprinellus micaceus]|uniref:Uncharacterized protein n=1 Tax=Coprinellus micaceus TaxID=71717 RepID=A0A4Y7SD35_COPMI|nr:hypothetical protein FA13DRAFT_1718584 [Coprinellus micaceus]
MYTVEDTPMAEFDLEGFNWGPCTTRSTARYESSAVYVNYKRDRTTSQPRRERTTTCEPKYISTIRIWRREGGGLEIDEMKDGVHHARTFSRVKHGSGEFILIHSAYLDASPWPRAKWNGLGRPVPDGARNVAASPPHCKHTTTGLYRYIAQYVDDFSTYLETTSPLQGRSPPHGIYYSREAHPFISQGDHVVRKTHQLDLSGRPNVAKRPAGKRPSRIIPVDSGLKRSVPDLKLSDEYTPFYLLRCYPGLPQTPPYERLYIRMTLGYRTIPFSGEVRAARMYPPFEHTLYTSFNSGLPRTSPTILSSSNQAPVRRFGALG